ncbi:hypothetical protein G3480_21695 [Thiorhodococcus mannitoliphagus]|uniref:Uncharacterized protein n=1 Tax=Thiorhodococcus mannitoliphagus TaxID=329406 RepID=A0A6P1E314_9GAMM|nr:hypothetical protein [Thiorhodococcus mannitoliphagus]NEX22882.1 hypothetical protein [Thiorhodococcus mannitoliphagus]
MATTYAEILDLLGELIASQKETERRFQETDRKFQETGRLLREQSRSWDQVLQSSTHDRSF